MNIKQALISAIRFMRRKPLDVLLIAAFAAAIIKIFSLYLSVNTNDGNWEQFKTEHHCKLRMTEHGTQRASWECDDGEVYYRWRQQR